MKIMINHFFNYEFVYIFLFLSIIFLLIQIFIKQKLIRKLSILLFSLFFILCSFEFFLSLFMPLPQTEFFKLYMNDIDNNIYIQKEIEFFDKSNIKHKYKLEPQNFDENNYKDCVFIFNQNYSTYNNGFRVTKCNAESKDVFLFLGCSFMFGDGLDDYSTLPYIFSELFNFEKNIINCGVSANSYNTILNIINNERFIFLMNNSSKIKHCFCNLINDHIYRNFRYEGFCLDGYLYNNKKGDIPTTIGKIKYFFNRSYIFRKVFVSIIDECFKYYYENYTIKKLEEINKIVENKYGSKLTIVVWPDDYNELFIKKLKLTKLDLIFLPNKFNSANEGYKIKNDMHPTIKANKEVAKILYEHINEI